MYRYIIGLDVGSSKICASVGKVNDEGKISVIGTTMASCSGLKKGAVVDIDMTAEAIEKCIFSLEKIVEFKINEVYISIQGGICDFYNNKGVVAVENEDREISRSDVNRALEASKLISIEGNKEIIGAIPEQFIVDGYDNINDPIGMSGVQLEVEAKVILSQSTVVNNLIKSVNKAGIKVLGITLESMALSSSILLEDEKEKGVAVIDIGFDTINISVFKNKKLCKTIFIPLGGNNVTKDLSLCLNISYEEAEKLKHKYGALSKNDKEENISLNTSKQENNQVSSYKIVDIITARVDETLRFVRTFLKESGYYDEIHNIVLAGGGFTFLKDIINFSEEIFKKPIRIGMPQYIGAINPLYSTAVGIIMDVVKSSKLERVSSVSKNVELEDRVDCSIDENEDEEDNEKLGIMGKIKDFFADFF